MPDMNFAPIHAAPAGQPLYKAVARALLGAIESGQLKAGDALANEGELARDFGVSVGTLRKAVDELVAAQILLRQQGRGTFVATHTRDRFLFQFFQVQSLEGAKEFPQVETLDCTRGKADEAEAHKLGIRQGEAVLRIRNRLHLRGAAVVYDRICLPARLFKGLTEKRVLDRPSTLYHLYQVGFGVTVVRAQERLRAVACSREAARVLGLAAGTPVLQVHRVALGLNGQPVEYRVSTVDTAHHEYVSDLSPA